MATASPSHSAPGEVRADCLYTLAEVESRLGLGAAAIRRARRHPTHPLKVKKLGRKKFIVGADLIEHLKVAGV